MQVRIIVHNCQTQHRRSYYVPS